MTRQEMVALRDYVEALRLADQQALALAKAEIDRRLGEMNGWRRQLESERSRYITAENYSTAHEMLRAEARAMGARADERISALEHWHEHQLGGEEARRSAARRLYLAVTLVGAFSSALVTLILHAAGLL